MVRKEDVDELMSVFPVTRLHYVASDGCALLLREAVDGMDGGTFELFMNYHFATCERADLLGITSHAVDISLKKTKCGNISNDSSSKLDAAFRANFPTV